MIPAIGAKECIYNLCFAFLDPGDVALVSDPGYPVYTGGPLLAGAEAVLLPLEPELGFAPDLDALDAETLGRARLMFINYPNNPTGAVVPGRVLRAGRRARPRARDPGRPRQRLLGDDLRRLRRARASCHARRQGGRGRGLLALEGLQHDRLALRGDPRQRRRDRLVLAAEDERRLGPLRGGPARRRGGARRPARADRGDERDLRAPPRPRRRRAARDRGRGRGAEGDDLRLGAGPRGPHLDLVRRAGARGGGGGDLAGLDVRARPARASSGSR